ncbi:MAG: YbaN family protein [Burkholderiaceae bacterium]
MEEPAPPPSQVHRSRTVRALLWVVGSVSLILGIIGVVLPGLPTTPFILLTATCYAKASPRLHQWLLNHRWFGPLLQDWERNRSLTVGTKAFAIGSMVVMVSLAIWRFQGRVPLQILLLAAGVVGAVVVLRIPTRKP